MCPSGSAEIQTLSQAGGRASARMRSSVAGLVISAPTGSRYPKPAGIRILLMPRLLGSLRDSPATADESVPARARPSGDTMSCTDRQYVLHNQTMRWAGYRAGGLAS